MQRNTLATLHMSVLALALCAASIGAQAALTEDDFYIKNASDLVDFCHGFVSGAWQYHQSVTSGPKGEKLVCPVEPTPTRSEVVAMFVTWANAPEHAQYMSEPAVDVMFRFLIEKWPCAGAPAAKSEKKKK